MCKNDWSGPEYNHIDREQHGKLEDSVDIKPGGTWDSRHQLLFVIIMSLILRVRKLHTFWLKYQLSQLKLVKLVTKC